MNATGLKEGQPSSSYDNQRSILNIWFQGKKLKGGFLKGKIQLKGQEQWISDEGWSSGDKYKQHIDKNMRNKQPGTSTRSQGIDIQEQG